ncbi:Uncharacterised protein [Mycobacterium tuberculosis]|nr:Uncharacterised protein [Mycobacterium tuberculosis]
MRLHSPKADAAESDTQHPYLVKRVVAAAGDEVLIRGGAGAIC